MNSQNPAKFWRITPPEDLDDSGPAIRMNDEERCPDDWKNPMLNYVVLARFFELCDLADLKSFRQVSRDWHDISLTRWRNEMRVNLEPNIFLELNNVADLFSEELLKNPYKKYRLHGFVFREESDPARWNACGPIMLQFWEKCGPFICDMFIDRVVVQSNEDMECLRGILTRMWDSKLKKLDLYLENLPPSLEVPQEWIVPGMALLCIRFQIELLS